MACGPPGSARPWHPAGSLSPRSSPEHTSAVQWAASYDTQNASSDDLLASLPTVCRPVQRLSSPEPAIVAACLAGDGRPLVVPDALEAWPALCKWDDQYLAALCGDMFVTVNDRAPARHADACCTAGPQRSLRVRLRDYQAYAKAAGEVHTQRGGPFYLNGWCAFSECPDLLADCPPPLFTMGVDDSEAILAAVNSVLFGKLPPSHSIAATTDLSKVFMGPAGTITRLHYDAGDAHGWLAQVAGRKLFILYPPSDGRRLYSMPGEVETAQSAVDPLAPRDDQPLTAEARPLACLLAPGEALLLPRGWWHYALALDRSTTVMRNFYQAGTNAEGMARLVASKLMSLRAAPPPPSFE